MLDLLLPRVCAACRVSIDGEPLPATHVGRVLCLACGAALVLLPSDGCSLCQKRRVFLDGDGRCRRCASERSRLASCSARVEFEGNAENWIRAFKYPENGIAGLAPGPRSIVTALAHDAAQLSNAPTPDLIVPIPLHVNRLRARGFNPAAVLARAIAKRSSICVHTDLLLRTRDTPTQTHLGRKARRMNVRESFACADAVPANIWLIDDVVTTGSTLEEAARCLRAAGAKRVHAICVARTPAH
jgi:ComF family protein